MWLRLSFEPACIPRQGNPGGTYSSSLFIWMSLLVRQVIDCDGAGQELVECIDSVRYISEEKEIRVWSSQSKSCISQYISQLIHSSHRHQYYERIRSSTFSLLFS